MTDTWNVTAAYDKPSYNKGDTMTVTISGDDVLTTTTTTQQQSGAMNMTLTAADGSKTTIALPPVAVSVTQNVSAHQAVKITGIVDSTGRIWTIGANGLTATSKA